MLRSTYAVTVAFAASVVVSCSSVTPQPKNVPAPASKGAVAAVVTAGSALEKAGVKVGDVLLSWSRGTATGEIRGPFTLAPLFTEQLPLGPVTLTVLRGGETLSLTVPPGYSRGTYHPNFTPEHFARFTEIRTSADKEKRYEEAAAKLRELVPAVSAREGEEAALWVMRDAAEALALAGKLADAAAAYDEAIARAEGARFEAAAAQLAAMKGVVLTRGNDLAGAEKAYREALEIRRAAGHDDLSIAAALLALGESLTRRRDMDAAEKAYREALSIYEQRAPASRELAEAFNALARVEFFRGDMPAAEGLYLQALAVQEKVAPGGFEYASNLTGLGVAAFQRGDLAAAEGYWTRALAIVETLFPDRLEVAILLNNLSGVAHLRGDLAAADRHMRRVLAIREKHTPGSSDVAQTLHNLGKLAASRGELEEAEQLLQRGFELRQKLTPDSVDAAHSLTTLGAVARQRGQFDVARQYLERALALHQKLSPGSLEVARDYHGLATLALEQNDLKAARQFLDHARAVIQQRAPAGLDAADAAYFSGKVAHRAGDAATAERDLRQALEVRERLAPGSTAMAEALYLLGAVVRDQRRPRDAADLFRRAIDTLESQTARLGGSEETKSGFLATYQRYYRDLIDVLLELKRNDDAFHVLERSRAQRLLAMLAERDLLLSDVPPELERERKGVDREYEKTQQELAALNPASDADKIQQLRTKLRDVRARQHEIVERVRRESPRVAALKYPQPLDAAAASRSLDRGTVLLSYVVGEKSTVLFILESAADSGTRSPLSVMRVDAGEEELRRDVRRFRTLIERGAVRGDAVELQRRARELTHRLLPSHRAIARAERLLLSLDGPLHTLPFAALAAPAARARFTYLAEEKPLHVVLSATVYEELKKERERRLPADAVDLAAFGDPQYPGADGASTDPAVRSVVTRFGLEPLPATREEVVKIASLFGDSALQYLGGAAREEAVKDVAGRARYLHFASHAVVDEDFPLDSALALSIPADGSREGENGLLQAWEIFESLRVPAELVVLSACDTALGKASGGEGIVGLTRAFQYAGARSVLASLWSVSDTSTARLMEAFYTELRGGKSKDEALRLAQLALLRNADSRLAHPYHWAAFELVGDWK